jgi:hypothetical protein
MLGNISIVRIFLKQPSALQRTCVCFGCFLADSSSAAAAAVVVQRSAASAQTHNRLAPMASSTQQRE